MKGWLVYHEEDLLVNRVFAEALVSYGKVVGLEVELLLLEKLQMGVQGGALCIKDARGMHKEVPDFVINRTREHLFGYHLEQMGVRVLNNARVTHLCNHKARTHQLVAALGIPSVDTLFFHKRYMSLENLGLQFPLVIKSPIGHGGKQVYLANDLNEAHEFMERLSDEELVIQEVCDQVGVDVRVFVLGTQVLGAICRQSDTDFRSNYSLGGRASLYELSAQQLQLIQRILDVLESDYVGIDFMIDQRGEFVFNEIEDVVGSRTLYEYGNVDVAKCYMDYIAKELKGE
ncbi:MAG: ATP-grasp domain-containing protein [Cellulosilyticaceae bacterium]